MDNRLVYVVALVIGCCILATEGLIDSHVPVGELKTTFRREDCFMTKLCASSPENCDPSGNDTCLFGSAAAATTTPGVVFELSGNSDGYIFVILSPDENLGGNDEVFICAECNNTLSFFTANFDNGTLTLINKTGAASNVWASSIANVIRCKFTALALNATASGGSSDTTFYVFSGNGTIVNGTLGPPEIGFTSNGRVDLAFVPLTPVGVLTAPISRVGCGETKLCEEEPADCDPSGNGTCLFVSSATATTASTRKHNNNDYSKGSIYRNTHTGTNVTFELRGNSDGSISSFVVLILSPDKNLGGNDLAFVCAQFNNTVLFLTATFDNGNLTGTIMPGAVSDVMASFNDNVIACTFTALALNATATRGADTSYYIFAGTGSNDNEPAIMLSSGRLDLTDPTSNLPNGGTALHPASLVVLVLLSALISRLV